MRNVLAALLCLCVLMAILSQRKAPSPAPDLREISAALAELTAQQERNRQAQLAIARALKTVHQRIDLDREAIERLEKLLRDRGRQ